MSVKVIKNQKSGLLFTKKNEDSLYGTITLQQIYSVDTVFANSNGNIFAGKARICFFVTTEEIFDQLNWTEGTILEGYDIVRTTCYEPFYENQEPVCIPHADGSVEICEKNGHEYYQNYSIKPSSQAEDKHFDTLEDYKESLR